MYFLRKKLSPCFYIIPISIVSLDHKTEIDASDLLAVVGRSHNCLTRIGNSCGYVDRNGVFLFVDRCLLITNPNVEEVNPCVDPRKLEVVKTKC